MSDFDPEKTGFMIRVATLSNQTTTQATPELRWHKRLEAVGIDLTETQTLQQKWIVTEHEAGSGRLVRAESEWRDVPTYWPDEK